MAYFLILVGVIMLGTIIWFIAEVCFPGYKSIDSKYGPSLFEVLFPKRSK